MSEQLKAAPDGVLIEAYLKMRKLRDEAKRAFVVAQKPTLDGMQAIENEMLRRLNESETDSKSSDKGTAYVTSKKSATLMDREAFFNYVHSNDAWDLADLRANCAAVEKFGEANDGELPPGVKFNVEKAVNIRKKT